MLIICAIIIGVIIAYRICVNIYKKILMCRCNDIRPCGICSICKSYINSNSELNDYSA